MGLLDDLGAWLDRGKRRTAHFAQNPGLLWAQLNEDARQYQQDQRANWGDVKSVVPEVKAAGLLEFNRSGQELGGLLGTFAGVGAKTADVVKLEQAKKMVKAGADPVKVWQETGWTDQFPDGKWRFEIPDTDARFKYVKATDKGVTTAEQLDHPPLYAAYPDIAGVPKDIKFGNRVQTKGSYNDKPTESISVAGVDPQDAYGVAFHEGQHAVQQREGFARGGSPTDFDASVAQRARDVLAWRNEVDAYIKREWPQAKSDFETRMRADEALRGEYRKLGATDWMPNGQDAWAAIQADINPGTARRAELEKIVQEYGLDKRATPKSEMDMYRSLAGEAEARLTQSRMNLTPAERAARPPWLEFDVPPEQQIVRGLLGEQTGPAMSVREPTKFQLAHAEAQRNAALPVEQGGLGLGPQNTAMERAKAMGFDTPAFRGTDADEIKTAARTYVSPKPEVAGTFAGYVPAADEFGIPQMLLEGGNVMPLLIRNTEDATNVIKNYQWKMPGENVRSRFAAFDPKKKDSRDLLASMGLLGLLGYGAYGNEQ